MLSDKQLKVSSIKWYHCFDFGDGVYTHDEISPKLMRDKADVIFRYGIEGRSFLDIGAWDGYYSFEAERRGASKVLATDHFCWSGDGWGTKDGFDLAKELLGSNVDDLDIDIKDINPATIGRWDVVYMGGVLYHVYDLIKHLEIARDVTREYTVIETALDLQDIDRPAMSFVRGANTPRADMPLSYDTTNFFGPNALAVIAMLEYVGYKRIETFISESVDRQTDRGFFYAWR